MEQPIPDLSCVKAQCEQMFSPLPLKADIEQRGIAREAELERTSIYRAFAGEKLPNFSTVLRILDAMGFQLKVTERRGNRALARKRNAKS